MNLKDLFDKAENGTLTYDQLIALAAGAKFVDLTEGAYVAKQKYSDDLAARDTRITSLNDTLSQREKDLASLQEKLTAAGTDSEKLTKLNTEFADLQKKYETDTKAYQKQLKDQEYKFAVTDFVNGLKFSSQAAKRDFTNEMLNKKLTVDGGKIIGSTDFLEAYRTENADAFVVENPNPAPAPSESKPQFVSPTTPNGGTGESNPISFSFMGVRPHQNE